jgi:DNA-binding NarL/FixJ family response regulator
VTTDHRAHIAVVDDHALFAESLVTALRLRGNSACRIPVEQTYRSSVRLLPTILQGLPSIVLLDLDLGMLSSGMDLIGPLSTTGIAVVVVTGLVDRARWGECIERGARTVVPKHASLKEIVATVRRIENGLPAMVATERTNLLECWRDQKAREQGTVSRLGQLSRREAEVLGQLMSGLRVAEIAQQGFVSESTIRTQVKAVLAKLQVSSQLTAVGLAYAACWTPPDPDAHREAACGPR